MNQSQYIPETSPAHPRPGPTHSLFFAASFTGSYGLDDPGADIGAEGLVLFLEDPASDDHRS